MILRQIATRSIWLASQIVPPSLLTYFYLAWKRCAFEVAPYVDQAFGSSAGTLYRVLVTGLLLPTSALFLRLYLLPRSQSVPPYNPPKDILDKTTIFECLGPEEAKIINVAVQKASETEEPFDDIVVVNRCWRGKCNGRWKPTRARHCSECGVCRAGFDHHCAFFANCLTTSYMPAFLLTLVLAPIALNVCCLPIYRPFGRRLVEAWHFSRSNEQFASWWNWWPSWIVAGGPLGRYGVAVALAWREMDRKDGGGLFRFSSGVLIGFGLLLSAIAGGLAYTTIRLIRAGHLTIDRERARAHSRTEHAIAKLQAANQATPEYLTSALDRFAYIKHFYVPFNETGGGEIVATLPGETPYDLGTKENWNLVMGKGLGWLIPWRAMGRGMGDEIYNWPISPTVKARLIAEAHSRHSPEQDVDNSNA